MRRIYIIALLLLFSVALAAQNTKANARKLFNEGKYEEAKSILLQLLKKSPNSAEYNYWYAASCYETKDTVSDIEERLKMAAERRVLNAHYYLGAFYYDSYRFPEAVESYEAYLEVGKDEDMISKAVLGIEKANEMLRMIKMTERVCVIDSFILDKDKFLSAYKIGRDVGRLYMAADYFKNNSYSGVLSMTERGTDIYFSQEVTVDSVSVQKLFHGMKSDDEWSKFVQVKGFDTGGNDGYPFMSADGATFYFASDGEGSIGGYDIFVTRYDNENGRFLIPTNIGMPFNSEANDYMMVINEIANIGWFATDRRMPMDKVCVYVFIPNNTRQTYNYEELGFERMAAYSTLASVADTQSDENIVRKARQQLTMLLYEQTDVEKKGEFLFVIDDMTDYVALSDFKNPAARKLFQEWQKRTSNHKKEVNNLEEMRLRYAAENKTAKQKLVAVILEKERRIEVEADELADMEKKIRGLEFEYIKK